MRTTHAPESTVTTPAEQTATPGLVIAPRCDRDHRTGTSRFLSNWCVVHEPSGLRVPIAGLGLGQARDLAVLLGETGIDWTQPADEVRTTAARTMCTDLADWADQLDTTVLLDRTSGGGLRVEITDALARGQRLTLWNYLDDREENAVRCVIDLDDAFEESELLTNADVTLTADELRAAARHLS